MILETPRLRLRRWREGDRPAFAALNADPEVMHDLGGPISREKSDAKLDRYAAVFDSHGFGRWVIETPADEFIGYTGVMPGGPDHPLGRHHEIGWRLTRAAWGHGYASEAAARALEDALRRVGLPEVLAYTAPDNIRSQAVMARLGLRRDAGRDFTTAGGDAPGWSGLVWDAGPNWKPSLSVTKGG